MGTAPSDSKGPDPGSEVTPGGKPAEEQYRLSPEVADALHAAAHECTKSGNMLNGTSWTTEGAMAMMAR